MKTIFTVMMLMFFAWIGSVQAQVYPVGSTPTICLGGACVTANRAIVLSGYSAVDSRYDTLRSNGSQYQVTTGKTLYIIGYKCTASSAAASGIFALGYGDTAVSNSAAAPTNAVQKLFNASAAAALYTVATVGAVIEGPIYVTTPAGKYPFMNNNQLPTCTFLGFEQ